MDYHTTFQISASGLAAERLRLDVTALNLANMHTSAAERAALYQPQQVVTRPASVSFGALVGRLSGVTSTVVPQAAAPRMAYEPAHPFANAQGMVAYPGVDHTAEMLTMNLAVRAYEANLAAMAAGRVMAARTLELGGQG